MRQIGNAGYLEKRRKVKVRERRTAETEVVNAANGKEGEGK